MRACVVFVTVYSVGFQNTQVSATQTRRRPWARLPTPCWGPRTSLKRQVGCILFLFLSLSVVVGHSAAVCWRRGAL